MNADPTAPWIARSSDRYSLAVTPIGSPTMMPTPNEPLSAPRPPASSAWAGAAIPRATARAKAKRMPQPSPAIRSGANPSGAAGAAVPPIAPAARCSRVTDPAYNDRDADHGVDRDRRRVRRDVGARP